MKEWSSLFKAGGKETCMEYLQSVSDSSHKDIFAFYRTVPMLRCCEDEPAATLP
ncbi:hypothetical protein DPMN_035528 [Dreissena polymorpha]|uniref:Uncharacterized protein n=1 Tax=Dreissena polymorpha TaxID=45954 RepID=A0A9D4M9C1_DREPO|nr:hypothetical protein DPMN_035528 [Dreissena polymorpha]